MTNIIKLVKFDFRILKAAFNVFFFSFFILFTIVSFISSNPYPVIIIFMMFGAYFIITCFSLAEKNNIYKLYASLPVKKNNVVISRYIFSSMLMLVYCAFAVTLGYVVALIKHMPYSWGTCSNYIIGGILLSSFLLAVQFPFYFRYEFSKVRIIAALPYIAIFAIGIPLMNYIMSDPTTATNAMNVYNYLVQYNFMVWILGLGLSAMMLVVSGVIACQLFKKRFV